MEERSQFRVELEDSSNRPPVVVCEGEVDIYTAPEFEQTLERALEGGVLGLIVDLARVKFIDSTGLSVLVGGVKQMRERGGALAVVCADESIQRVFRVSGLDRILAVCATREEATGVLMTEVGPA